jgi:hypothetical protein
MNTSSGQSLRPGSDSLHSNVIKSGCSRDRRLKAVWVIGIMSGVRVTDRNGNQSYVRSKKLGRAAITAKAVEPKTNDFNTSNHACMDRMAKRRGIPTRAAQ